jgi:5'-3' exonuclease
MSNIFEFENLTMTQNLEPTFLFIDGSYYCFHKYYALIHWWKITNPEVSLEDPFQNEIFLRKFRDTFVNNLLQIPKKLKITNPIIIVGKDCKRENIWRNELFSKYKGNRLTDANFKGGPFFKMAYEDNLFEKGGANAILKHSKLEADDCIAISVKYLLTKYPLCNIYIITSDRDYLQLNSERVNIFDLSFKNIALTKNSTGISKTDLEIKIIMGDKSDNIPSVFPKCGQKTAQKCVEDNEFFKKKMSDNEEYYKQYELNKTLVDFNNIPQQLVDEFMISINCKT